MHDTALLRCLWLGAWLSVCAGCLVNNDKVCGDNEVELSGQITGCVCAPGAVPNADGNGCIACGAHEEAKSGSCVCEAGYQRPQPTAACEPAVDAGADDDAGAEPAGSAPTGVGMPCKGPEDCASYDATFCQTLQEPNVCLQQGCAVGDSVCSGGDVCCVFDVLPQLKAANGLCVPDGMCAPYGMVVTP